jgi:hypothetical protein
MLQETSWGAPDAHRPRAAAKQEEKACLGDDPVKSDCDECVDPADVTGMPRSKELDVDAWFAQREQMITQLRERREALLAEVRETERKLQVLGALSEGGQDEVPMRQAPAAPRAPARRPTPAHKAKAKAKAKTKARAKKLNLEGLGEKTAGVISAVTQKPEKIAVIARRLGLRYIVVYQALDIARKRGLVKSIGTKGKDVLWSLA